MPCYNLAMKLIRTFEITSDEFYDYLETQLLEQISKTTKKNVRKNVIQSGYSYENKDARSKIVIDKYVRGQIYQSTVKSATSFVRVCYETQETKEGLQIRFEQFISGEENLPQRNVLYRTWHNWITFGRMSHVLYDMRDDIFKIRNGEKIQKNSTQPEVHKHLKKFLAKKYEEQDQ